MSALCEIIMSSSRSMRPPYPGRYRAHILPPHRANTPPFPLSKVFDNTPEQAIHINTSHSPKGTYLMGSPAHQVERAWSCSERRRSRLKSED